MQIKVEVPTHLGIGPHIARALHSLSSVPRTMTRDEARKRLTIVAVDLHTAAQFVHEAVEQIPPEPRPRRIGRSK